MTEKSNWFDEQSGDEEDYSDDSERDQHYRHLARAGMELCLCGHMHPGDLDDDVIYRVYSTCWRKCGCTEYRPSGVRARDLTYDQMSRLGEDRATKQQPVSALLEKMR